MSEEWKQMVDHPKFLVSSEGKISDRRGKVYAQWINHEGYAQICLCENNHKFVVKVHREVAKAFIQKPDGRVIVNHKDGNKLNNSVSNLEWCSYSYNAKHAIALGLANKPEPIRCKVMCIETQKVFESMSAAERETGVAERAISACCRGIREMAGGFHWIRADGLREWGENGNEKHASAKTCQIQKGTIRRDESKRCIKRNPCENAVRVAKNILSQAE